MRRSFVRSCLGPRWPWQERAIESFQVGEGHGLIPVVEQPLCWVEREACSREQSKEVVVMGLESPLWG